MKFKPIGCLVLLTALMTGCSSGHDDAHYQNYSKDLDYKESHIAMNEEVAMAESMMADDGGIGQSSSNLHATVSVNRKMIQTGSILIESTAFDAANKSLNEQVVALGGFMESDNINGDADSRNRSRYATLRLPKEHFETFLTGAEQYGKVLNTSVSNEDITSHYVDSEMRLETLIIQAERLQDLLKQAGELQDLFAIEKELASVMYQIEALKGTLQDYDSLVDFSTIHLTLDETIEYEPEVIVTPNLGGKIVNQFEQSLRALESLVEGLVLLMVGMSPFALTMMLVGGPIYLYVKHKKKKP